MPEEIKHHEFSPSRLNQFAACPGAYRMQLGLSEETKSPDAEEGTMLHARLAASWLGGSDHLSDLNAEQVQAVESCKDYLSRIINDEATETRVPRDMDFEHHLVVRDNGEVLTSGTADVVLFWSDNTADLIDWKFGRGEVPAVTENYQLAAYAVGIHQELGCSSVTAHIVQPRLYKTDSYTFHRFDNLLSVISRVIERAKSSGEMVLRPTENACKYCLAKSTCPAFAARFSALAKIDTKRDLTDPNVLLDYWEKSQVVEKFICDVKKAVTAYIEEHGRLGDWILTERAGKREIKDTAALYDRVSGLLTSRELSECYTVSVTAILEKLATAAVTRAAAKGEKLSIKKAKEDAEALLGDIIQRGNPSQTLTRRPEK